MQIKTAKQIRIFDICSLIFVCRTDTTVISCFSIGDLVFFVCLISRQCKFAEWWSVGSALGSWCSFTTAVIKLNNIFKESDYWAILACEILWKDCK